MCTRITLLVGGVDMGTHNLKPTIAVDFDGTLCTDAWPNIGKPNIRLIKFLINWRKQGNKVILWTCREGDMLESAVKWCESYRLIFDAVNANLPERIEYYKNDSRKIGADYYIDDFNTLIVFDKREITPRRKEIWIL